MQYGCLATQSAHRPKHVKPSYPPPTPAAVSLPWPPPAPARLQRQLGRSSPRRSSRRPPARHLRPASRDYPAIEDVEGILILHPAVGPRSPERNLGVRDLADRASGRALATLVAERRCAGPGLLPPVGHGTSFATLCNAVTARELKVTFARLSLCRTIVPDISVPGLQRRCATS
jgi:hypothetical protein